MLRNSRDYRLQSRLAKAAVHCRHIILGIGALLAAVMAAAPPAAAIDRVITFDEARSNGAVFETINNPNNCIVSFLPAGNLAEVSGVVSADCTSATSPNPLVVRLFSGIVLNPGWIVSELRLPVAPIGHAIRRPNEGGRDPRIDVGIFVRAGQSSQVPVTLVVKAGQADKPICPGPTGRSGVFTCENGDCQDGSFCSMPCGFCTKTPFTERAASRVLTIGEMRDLGYPTPKYPPPWSGTDRDAFRIIWAAPGRCKASWDNGRNANESLAVTLNCSGFGYRHIAATATFQMFSAGFPSWNTMGIALNPPWRVESATVTQFESTGGSSASQLNLPVTNDIDLFTRVKLDAKTGKEARAAVTIRIAPSIGPPLPDCSQTRATPALCSMDEDCTGGTTARPDRCTLACGNRCMRPN